ncbi:Lipoprotein-releasing system ATP-binding protein LolD [Geodia barretti]|nr:Lipoprotein-releasing system ATP-binding protein LolD [Geodia barretti]
MAFKNRDGDVEKRARELLERVGLSHRLSHRPAELSGGERQRVAVARALINQPSVILCDEPTGNLDHSTADEVSSLLFELHQAEQNILIVVTHNLELASRFGRRFELEAGRCAEV